MPAKEPSKLDRFGGAMWLLGLMAFAAFWALPIFLYDIFMDFIKRIFRK